MTLSELIRTGAGFRPQVRLGLYAPIEGSDTFGSCVIGAAFEGLYGTPFGTCREAKRAASNADFELSQDVPALSKPADCPECGRVFTMLWVCLTHLNDSHQWTREQIAEWLDRRPQ